MKQKKPPLLAQWLLEHLTPASADAALTGDLLEEFRNGRSVFWYWRQVVTAIVVGYASAIRTHWFVAVFSFFWTMSIPAFWMVLIKRVETSRFLAWRWTLDWPYSTICDLGFFFGWQAVYLWTGLAFYLLLFSLISKPLKRPDLWRASWINLALSLTAFAGMIGVASILPERTPVFHIGTSTLVVVDLRSLLCCLPLFAGLTIAILSALPKAGDRRLIAASV